MFETVDQQNDPGVHLCPLLDFGLNTKSNFRIDYVDEGQQISGFVLRRWTQVRSIRTVILPSNPSQLDVSPESGQTNDPTWLMSQATATEVEDTVIGTVSNQPTSLDVFKQRAVLHDVVYFCWLGTGYVALAPRVVRHS